MTIVDAIAWVLMAAGLLRVLHEARDEHEQSLQLEQWLLAIMLNGTSLALWNASAGPVLAFRHWLTALVSLWALRLALNALRSHASTLRPLYRAAPTATAALGLLWLYGLRP